MKVINLVRKYPLTAFFLLTLFISFGIGIPAYMALKGLQSFFNTEINNLNDLVLRFGPSLAAVWVVYFAFGYEGVKHLLLKVVQWRASPWLYLFAVSLPPVILLGSFTILGYGYNLGDTSVRLLGITFLIQLSIHAFFGGGMGEELGWRGFMLIQLLKSHSPLVASVIITVFWVIWHLPAFIFAGKGTVDPFLPFLVMAFPLSFLLTWLTLTSGGGLLLPILFHGSLNASFYTLLEFFPDDLNADNFQPGFDWLVALILWGVGLIPIYILWDKK